MREESLVSVIIPMYNAEESIKKTLDSILSQTYANIEIIVIDDLSTDNSKTVVEEYMECHDNILFLELQKKGGASIARNCGIKNAQGKYIAFLDADDTWKPEKLEKQIAYMENNNIDFCYTYYEIYKNSNVPVKIRKAPKKVKFSNQILGNNIGCLTAVYNREKIGEIQIPRIDKRNDMALWQRILKQTKFGVVYPEVLATYFVTENSLSRDISKISMLKYHYRLFRINLEYNPITSSILSFCNILAYFKMKIFYTHELKLDEEIKLGEENGNII
ncbi:glycosyltransferase family 2 protein [Erysipelothrix rhusiopathiae]|uniref:Glycosyltransferase family 2 protein n=1 Tax=Erysipelothrix rhusiopathiae TaxID=1648 RepID=A0A6S6I7E0_ERYRH|nr:glycosyltransferase family 2 protein [Erysipelothrix rhusiopathiae]BCB22719.1 glycosyltransferase family 2 protein [Erysipelothrix rhusiopathiae]